MCGVTDSLSDSSDMAQSTDWDLGPRPTENVRLAFVRTSGAVLPPVRSICESYSGDLLELCFVAC